MKKRLLSLALTLAMLLLTVPTAFAPDRLLNREQAATMLTRVFKRATMPGWNYAADAQYPLQFTQPGRFADDALISDWAKESVYFMAANQIINSETPRE